MIIICDRCKKSTVDFYKRDRWLHIESSINKIGRTADYYLCPKCREDFYNFMDIRTVDTKEE